MNKMISWTGKIVPLAVLVGVFCLLKQLGCPVNECCMITVTLATAIIAYQNKQQNKVGIEASQRQAEAATEQTKAIQQQIEISKQQTKAAEKQAEAAIQSLKEAQKQWKEEYRPRFVVYFVGGSEDAFWYLTIENIGKTSAYDMEASCDSFQDFPEYPRKRSYFPPGRKEILDRLYMNPGDRSITNHKKLHLKLRYTDCNKKPFEESVEVFFSSHWSL